MRHCPTMMVSCGAIKDCIARVVERDLHWSAASSFPVFYWLLSFCQHFPRTGGRRKGKVVCRAREGNLLLRSYCGGSCGSEAPMRAIVGTFHDSLPQEILDKWGIVRQYRRQRLGLPATRAGTARTHHLTVALRGRWGRGVTAYLAVLSTAPRSPPPSRSVVAGRGRWTRPPIGCLLHPCRGATRRTVSQRQGRNGSDASLGCDGARSTATASTSRVVPVRRAQRSPT